jgi:hypothetical protein
MKRKVILSALALAMIVGMVAYASQDKTGNGAPSGNHFTLNIIGIDADHTKNVNMNQGAGNTIFVLLGEAGEDLDRHTKIILTEGDDFAVLDKNGTDGEAEFMLPAPGTDAYEIGHPDGNDTTTDYSVFVRPLGKPGGWCEITTCADVVDSNFGDVLPKNVYKEILNSDGYFGGYASIEQVGYEITYRDSKKSTFANVTAQLTTIVFEVWVDLDAEGDQDADEIFYVRVPIFDESLEGEYWDYDNFGLKVLQVRFYPGVSSDLTEWDGSFGG